MKNNFAFIDSQNLYLSVLSQGWKIDWAKFRIYLKEKHNVEKAYLFIGRVQTNVDLYRALQDAGYICIWKPTLEYKDGTIKGNCDAELVLHTMIQFDNFEKAVIISGDGDFYCLIDYLIDQYKLDVLLIPNVKKYSALLKVKKFAPYKDFITNLKNKIQLK
jgi:uncharacterized LabA/DUF88 family protein